jgi:dihydroorotase
VTDDAHYDLVIRGAELLDPDAGIAGTADLAVHGGRIAAIEPRIPAQAARTVIDGTGQYLFPGLVDLHTHVYPEATYWGIDPAETAWRTGVTTWVDAGSAGAYNLRGLRQRASTGPLRTFAFLNISALGLTAETGELRNLDHCDAALCARMAADAGEFIVGVKARIEQRTVGENGLEPLRRARAAARALGRPLMVHISNGPPTLAAVLGLLDAGDIVTHCTTPGNMSPIGADGTLKDGVRAAIDNGVVFDVGHGYGAFSFAAAEALLAAAGLPHVISSDIHQLSIRGPMFDLPTCMSKFLSLGMSLPDVVRATTSTPARVIGRDAEVGSLQVGRRADLGMFRFEDGDFVLYDVELKARRADRLLTNTLTLAGDLPLPAVAPEPAPPWIDRTETEPAIEARAALAWRRPGARRAGLMKLSPEERKSPHDRTAENRCDRAGKLG